MSGGIRAYGNPVVTVQTTCVEQYLGHFLPTKWADLELAAVGFGDNTITVVDSEYEFGTTVRVL